MKNKKYIVIIKIFAWSWILTWFLSIWIVGIGRELFLTGLLCLILALIFSHEPKKGNK